MHIEELINNPNITEIIILSGNRVLYEHRSQLTCTNIDWGAPQNKSNFEQSIINALIKAPSYENPMAKGVWKNFRVQVLSPPVIAQDLQIQLRRFASNKNFKEFKNDDWSLCSFNKEIELILAEKFAAKENFLIVGATGTGKTTLLKSLLFSFCKSDRVICLEDTPELPQINSLSTNLRTYDSSTPEIPNIKLNDLVETSLRLRPDRLMMGEMRGAEAASFLLMLSTGHKGSGATLHAHTPLDALYRLEMLTQLDTSWSQHTVRKLIHSALDFILVMERDASGKRYISKISEIAGLERDGFLIHHVYTAKSEAADSQFNL